MRTSHARYRSRQHAVAYAAFLTRQLDTNPNPNVLGATFTAVPDPYDPFYFHAILVTHGTMKPATYAARTHGWRYRRQAA